MERAEPVPRDPTIAEIFAAALAPHEPADRAAVAFANLRDAWAEFNALGDRLGWDNGK